MNCSPYTAKPTQLGSIKRASRFHLKPETESCLRNVVFLNKSRTTDNVQKHDICVNVPSSQTFRSNSLFTNRPAGSRLHNDDLVQCTGGWAPGEACRELKRGIRTRNSQSVPCTVTYPLRSQSGAQQQIWACVFRATTRAPSCSQHAVMSTK
jgi:hypothetical protein